MCLLFSIRALKIAIISSGSFFKGRTYQPYWPQYIFIYSRFKCVQTLAHICQELYNLLYTCVDYQVGFSPKIVILYSIDLRKNFCTFLKFCIIIEENTKFNMFLFNMLLKIVNPVIFIQLNINNKNHDFKASVYHTVYV